MKIGCKEGVWFKFIDEKFLKLAQIVHDVYQEQNVIPVVTSACDSKHSANSYHYVGLAWDWRIWGLQDVQRAADKIRLKAKELDFRYDIVYGDPKHKDHIHTEYDVRKGG